jgi:hypothetical protein
MAPPNCEAMMRLDEPRSHADASDRRMQTSSVESIKTALRWKRRGCATVCPPSLVIDRRERS